MRSFNLTNQPFEWVQLPLKTFSEETYSSISLVRIMYTGIMAGA